MKINNTEILYLKVVLDGAAKYDDYDHGALTLRAGDRESILDGTRTLIEYHEREDQTTLVIDLERDDVTFPDCKHDLTEEDLVFDCKKTFYFESSVPVVSMTLFLQHGLMMIAKEVNQEI